MWPVRVKSYRLCVTCSKEFDDLAEFGQLYFGPEHFSTFYPSADVERRALTMLVVTIYNDVYNSIGEN